MWEGKKKEKKKTRKLETFSIFPYSWGEKLVALWGLYAYSQKEQ